MRTYRQADRRDQHLYLHFCKKWLTVCFGVLADDIMYEVFKAMKSLDFEWKVFNPYHVIVRKKPDNPTYEPVSFTFLDVVFKIAVSFILSYLSKDKQRAWELRRWRKFLNIKNFSPRWAFSCIKWIKRATSSILKALLMRIQVSYMVWVIFIQRKCYFFPWHSAGHQNF